MQATRTPREWAIEEATLIRRRIEWALEGGMLRPPLAKLEKALARLALRAIRRGRAALVEVSLGTTYQAFTLGGLVWAYSPGEGTLEIAGAL